VASVCRAAGTPHTTALRWLSLLENEGMVERIPAPHDRRTQHIRLTAQAKAALSQWLNQRAALWGAA
jgi:DNA-binding MarR family transcriptional regulator